MLLSQPVARKDCPAKSYLSVISKVSPHPVVESIVRKEGKYMNLVKRLIKEEEGQGMIEYVIIAAFISIIAIVTIKLIGPKVENVWTNVDNAMTNP